MSESTGVVSVDGVWSGDQPRRMAAILSASDMGRLEAWPQAVETNTVLTMSPLVSANQRRDMIASLPSEVIAERRFAAWATARFSTMNSPCNCRTLIGSIGCVDSGEFKSFSDKQNWGT
jgi:hypothetical protein